MNRRRRKKLAKEIGISEALLPMRATRSGVLRVVAAIEARLAVVRRAACIRAWDAELDRFLFGPRRTLS